MKKIFILFSVLFLTVSFVYSAEWYVNDRFGFMIDKSSIIKTKDSIQSWVIIVRSGKIKNKKYAHTEQYMEVNCLDKTMATLEVTYFSKKNIPLGTYNFEQQNMVQHNRVVPGTIGEAIYNDLCSMR